MAKPLSMVSHKNYNLGANEDFVMFLTFKLITCFIDRFTLKGKSHSIVYSMEVNIHIGFWTLKMKCTQYGLYEQAAFKNARVKLGSCQGWGVRPSSEIRPRSGQATFGG